MQDYTISCSSDTADLQIYINRDEEVKVDSMVGHHFKQYTPHHHFIIDFKGPFQTFITLYGHVVAGSHVITLYGRLQLYYLQMFLFQTFYDVLPDVDQLNPEYIVNCSIDYNMTSDTAVLPTYYPTEFQRKVFFPGEFSHVITLYGHTVAT